MWVLQFLGGAGGCTRGGSVGEGKQNPKSLSSDFGHPLVHKGTEFKVNPWGPQRALGREEAWILRVPGSPQWQKKKIKIFREGY